MRNAGECTVGVSLSGRNVIVRFLLDHGADTNALEEGDCKTSTGCVVRRLRDCLVVVRA